MFCCGDSIVLNFDGNLDYIYFWIFVEGLSVIDVVNLMVLFSVIMVYIVSVLNIVGFDICVVIDQVMVFVLVDINLDFGDDVIICGEDVVLYL